MKQRAVPQILFMVAGLLIFVGIAPLACSLGWVWTHDLESLSMPIPLKRGEYTSPLFATDLDDEYQIEIYDLPPHLVPLDVDWKIGDDAGALIRSGRFHEDQMGGNAVVLDRGYRPKQGSRYRIIVNIAASRITTGHHFACSQGNCRGFSYFPKNSTPNT